MDSTTPDNGYRIVARIVAEDATGAGARSAEKRLVEVENKARSVGGNILGYLGRAFAMLGGTALLGGVAKSFVGLNDEIETARNGLATLYSALSGISITDGLTLARSELAGLQADARKGVGELANYVEGYSKILGPGLNAGMSLDSLRELNRNALAAGAALRGDQGLWMAPMDLTQALTSGATDKTTPIVAAALGAAGIAMDKFNAMAAPEKFRALNDAFLKFAPGVELMGRSWSAQSSTMTDNIKEFVRLASLPLFEKWTERLRTANDWIDRNRDTVNRIAETLGTRLVAIWDHLIEQGRTYVALLAAAAALQAAPTVVPLARGAAASARSGGATLMGALRDPLGMGALFGSTAAGSTGLGGLAASLRGLVGTAARAAGPVAVLTTLVMGVTGAMEEFPAAVAYVGTGVDYLLDSFGALGASFGSLTAEGSALNLVGGALLWALGGLARVGGGVVRVIASLVEGLALVFRVVGDGYRSILLLAQGRLAEAAQVDVLGRVQEANENLRRIWAGPSYDGAAAPEGGSGTVPTLPFKKGGDTNISIANAKFEMKTEANADPARVMTAWEEVADRLVRFPLQAKRLPSAT